MYKRDAPGGWTLLDDYHSPGDTARYVRQIAPGRQAVVDVISYGRQGEWQVYAQVETGELEAMPHGTEMSRQEQIASNVTETAAFQAAMDFMKRPPSWATRSGGGGPGSLHDARGEGTVDSEFDFSGGDF